MDTFVTCVPGLETLLEQELLGLGIPPTSVEPGGVSVPRDPAAAARITRESGIATGVLWRVSGFRCRSLGELAHKSASLPWGETLRGDAPVCLRVHSRKSRLYHTGAIAERVAKGLSRASGCTVVDAPKGDVAAARSDDPVPIIVRFDRDDCLLSIDLAGVPLHRRGYRVEPGNAPLREDLAAALLRASGWQPGEPLLDPMCGAGTLVIEAARLQAGIPPGSGRPMAWQRTLLADSLPGEAAGEGAGEAAPKAPPPSPPPLLQGSDRNAEQLDRARANAERAGVADRIQWTEAPLSGAPWFQPAENGADGQAVPGTTVITHPPFGLRTGKVETLRALHQTLGRAVQGLPVPWNLALLVQDRKLAYATGVRMRSAFQTRQANHSVHGMVGGAGPQDP